MIPEMIKITEYSNKAEKQTIHINIYELSEIKGNKASGYAVVMKNGSSYKVMENPEYFMQILKDLRKPTYL